ncbi:MAG TPA: glycoside hydrolase family 9 protein [Prolixibacteraceae bacterium]|nr:glycoside hydrolase family 9 protein [Prolixibacteraceae bacterium]
MKAACFLFFAFLLALNGVSQNALVLNEKGYFEMRGLNVTVFADIYPEGHQTGVTIIQHGERVAANGDVRLEVSPGQWSPIPKAGRHSVDPLTRTITQELWFPDSSRNRRGFNPIEYPDLKLRYKVNVTPLSGSSVKITVDLDEPLPAEWEGKVGFNFELFPTHLFGKTYWMDRQTGIFPQQANGPLIRQPEGDLAQALAKGKKLIVTPEEPLQKITIETKGALELWDGRSNHNNGWYIVREPLAVQTTKNALEWVVTPNVVPEWVYEPVIHISQVGYHPKQAKKAVIETDQSLEETGTIRLMKITPDGLQSVKDLYPKKWGLFLRYHYFIADFSEITEAGMYLLECGKHKSNPFRIDDDVYQNHVWQPVIDYFLPVQMCHMRVNEKYRVWHDACHLDDALMAPTDLNHFDGYHQGPSTLTDYQPYDAVPGLNEGGWHDAGDYDLRVESQIGEVALLSMMIEEFGLDYDATTIDWEQRVVEIHQTDGVNDLLQQIEHGLRSVLGAYRSLGRLYRGIICSDLRQYVMLGDAAAMTDNKIWDGTMPVEWRDDRMVFTESNPSRECKTGAGLALAARVLQSYKPALAKECLETALAIWETSGTSSRPLGPKVELAAELLITTQDPRFADALYSMEDLIVNQARRVGWAVGRALPLLKKESFKEKLAAAILHESERVVAESEKSPFGVPYRPSIWGDGWTIQRFGVEQYFVHKAWPEITTPDYFIDALNFVLGVHPGRNTASFASGIGAESATVAYGVNRADWSYIPGGVVSGTAMIRPDLPEFKIWPYFWQQTEYVMGGGSTNFMFLVLAVDHYLNKK